MVGVVGEDGERVVVIITVVLEPGPGTGAATTLHRTVAGVGVMGLGLILDDVINTAVSRY